MCVFLLITNDFGVAGIWDSLKGYLMSEIAKYSPTAESKAKQFHYQCNAQTTVCSHHSYHPPSHRFLTFFQ